MSSFSGPRADSFLSLSRSIKTSWTLLTPAEKRFFIFRFFLRALLNGVDIIAISLMGLLGAVTAGAISGTTLSFSGVQLPEPSPGNITLLVALIALLYVAKGGVAIGFDWWNSVLIAQIEIRNASKLARYMFGGTLDRMRGKSRADVGFLLGTSVSATFSGVLGSASSLLLEGTVFLSIFIVFLIVDWVSALGILLYFGVVVTIIQLTSAKRYLKAGRNIQKASVDAGGAVLELVDGFREISVLSKQDFYLSRYVEARKLDARTAVNLQVLKGVPRYVAESGLILGAFGFVIFQLNQGTLSDALVALGIFLAGSFRMMGAILPLQQIWNDLRLRQIFVGSVHEILIPLLHEIDRLDSSVFKSTQVVSPQVAGDPLEFWPTRGLEVRLTEVSFVHQARETAAVNRVTLSVSSGEFAAIVGPSGAGKTTLVDLMLGLYEPLSGVVEVSGSSPREIRDKFPGCISYVPQRPGLVAGTIAENVALGLELHEIDENRVWEVLEQAQLLTLVRGFPDGLNSTLGNHADAMSGGQIQRLGLARALYSSPSLLVLDEATSALDATTEANIADSIRKLGEVTTVIVIAHRLSTIQHADVVHVMDEGRVISSGTFAEVRRAVPMIEDYVKLMSFDD